MTYNTHERVRLHRSAKIAAGRNESNPVPGDPDIMPENTSQSLAQYHQLLPTHTTVNFKVAVIIIRTVAPVQVSKMLHTDEQYFCVYS